MTMSNQFPDPSLSPWTHPDTGVEFVYDAETDSWAPAKDSTPGTGETLDTVSKRDPKTDINVTVGNTIGMDDSEDAFNGGPHELETRTGKFGEITQGPTWVKTPKGYPIAYSPTLDMHILASRYGGHTFWRGSLGSQEAVTLQHNGKSVGWQSVIWAKDRFIGFIESPQTFWESLDGYNWDVIEGSTIDFGWWDSNGQTSFYHAGLDKLVTTEKDATGPYVAISDVGDYVNQQKIYPDLNNFVWNTRPDWMGGVLTDTPGTALYLPSMDYDQQRKMAWTDDLGVTWNYVDVPANEDIRSIMQYVNGEWRASNHDGDYDVWTTDFKNWEYIPVQVYNRPDFANQDPYDPETTWWYSYGSAVLYHNGIYFGQFDSYAYTDWSRGTDKCLTYSRDKKNWVAFTIEGPLPERMWLEWSNMFIDKDDNLVLSSWDLGQVYYLPDVLDNVVHVDQAGLYFDDNLVATRENLDPVIDIINNHSDQINDLNGKFMPLDINTLPSV